MFRVLSCFASFGLVVALLFLAVNAPAADPVDISSKLQIPSKEDRARKRTEIDDVFEVAAAQTANDKALLANKLLTTGQATTDDPAAQFALFNCARELALDAGDFDLTLSAIAALDNRFVMDVNSVKVMSLEQLLKSRLPDDAKRNAMAAGSGVLEELLAANQFDRADHLVSNMLQLAARLRDRDAVSSLTELRNRGKQMQAQYQQAKTALETLATNPSDGAANLSVGRYYAFVVGNWNKALPYLSRCDNDQLREAAQLESKNPTDGNEQIKVADAWWNAGQNERGHAATEIKVRSAHWYKLALASVSGLSAEKARQRMAEVSDLVSIASSTGHDAADAGGPVTDKKGIEWIPVQEDGKLMRCISVGPFPAEADDLTILSLFSKSKVGDDLGGRKVERKDGEADGKMRGPLVQKSEQYYLFRVKCDREQAALLVSETFTNWGHSTIDVYVNSRPAPKNGQIGLARGENVIIVKQNHNKSDRDDRSWITLVVKGEGLEQGY